MVALTYPEMIGLRGFGTRYCSKCKLAILYHQAGRICHCGSFPYTLEDKFAGILYNTWPMKPFWPGHVTSRFVYETNEYRRAKKELKRWSL